MSDAKEVKHDESVPFYPDHVRTELWVAGGLTLLIVVIGAIGLFSPVGLGEAADPMNTPTHVKPEWYFLGLYQLLKYIPKTMGAVLPVILLIIWGAWPFLDRRPDRSARESQIRLIVMAVLMVILIGLTIWGEVG